MAKAADYKFYFQNSCSNVALATFTPSNNGGKQAFTINSYPNAGEDMDDYFDEGDELSFTYDGNYYTYGIIDITGDQITMSFDYNAAITNVNTTLQFSIKEQCYPYNFHNGKFTWEKDKDNFFYRMKYQGRIKFKNNKDNDDYSYLLAALDDGCCKVLFKVFKLCGGEYSLFYRANITRFEGTWNESQCTFETEILPVDKYSCVVANGDVDVNLYQSTQEATFYHEDDELVSVTQGPFFEFWVSPTIPTFTGDSSYVNGPGANFTQIINAGVAVDANTGNPWTVTARALKVVVYTGDPLTFVTPSISGWTFTDEIRIDGKIVARYTQLLTESIERVGVVWGTSGECATSQFDVVIYDPVNDNCIALYINFDATPAQYNSVTLADSLNLMIRNCSNVQNITSDFFEIDPVGDTPGYSSGINYVTGLQSFVNYLTLSAISDVLNVGGITATVLNYSFNKMMKDLNAMFNVYWFIDSQSRVRIEHYSYFTNNSIVNLIGAAPNGYKKEYTYIKEDVPNRERFKFRYAQNVDFVGTDIVYPDACSDKPVTLERSTNIVTDIYYLRNAYSGTFDNEGIVMFSAKAVINASEVLYDIGRITGVSMQNAHLSWANLQYNYHQHGRILESGLLNFVDTDFISWKKRKKQNNQKYLNCCLTIPETLGTVTTEVGTGNAIKIEFDINSNVYEFDLEI